MSNDEIGDFLNNEELSSIFGIRHSKEQMKILFDENIKNEKRYLELQKQISTLGQQLLEYRRSSEEKEKLSNSKFSEMQKEIERQKEIISNYYKSNEEIKNFQLKQQNKLKELDSRLQNYEELKNKIFQQEKLISKYQKENEELRKSLSEQETKLNLIEEKLNLQVKISVKVESDCIKGSINIIEKITKLDKKRSKYILNTNGAQILGENEYRNGTEIKSQNQNISISQPPGTYFLHALIVDDCGKINEIVSEPLTTKIDKIRFDYTGRVQSVNLSSGTYKLEVWGSAGGENRAKYNDGSYINYAGRGGYSVGTLKLNKETTLYVYVGGSSNTSSGGWNGGGSTREKAAAAGGGSTDISLYGETGSTEWNTANHLYSRIIVAGGGGGSSHTQYPGWQADSEAAQKEKKTTKIVVKAELKNLAIVLVLVSQSQVVIVQEVVAVGMAVVVIIMEDGAEVEVEVLDSFIIHQQHQITQVAAS